MKTILLLSLILCSLSPFELKAQDKAGAEILDTLAYLEKILARRLSDELSTQISKDQFELGARLEIEEIRRIKNNQSIESVSDLELGYLQPEKLYENYRESKDKKISGSLARFKIKKVTIKIGLKRELGETIKKEVDTWLQTRLKNEFGKLAQGQTQFINFPKTAPEKPKSPWLELIDQFQSLLGLSLLGLAVLLGLFFLALYGNKSKAEKNDATVNVNNKLEGDLGSQRGDTAEDSEEAIQKTIQYKQVLDKLNQQIRDIGPQLKQEMDEILREWCSKGEIGFIKVACFSEVVGKAMGRLPIPSEFYNDISKAFVAMPKLDLQDKVKHLEAVLWDLLSVLNLGGDSIHQPFSYLGSADVETMKEVLLENNSKLRTVVSLYMTDKSRKKYMSELDTKDKLAMLADAAELSEISSAEIQSIDNQLAPHFEVDSVSANISMELTLRKLIESMTQMESCVLLKDIQGIELDKYKKNYGHLAFLHEWPDASLILLYKQATSEQLIALLQIRKDLTARSLKLVPPMTRIIIEDDLAKARMSDPDRNVLLEGLNGIVGTLVANQDIDLAAIFSKSKSKDTASDKAA